MLLALVVLILAACSSGHPATRLKIPRLPTGWKTVTYHGIGVDVPRNWTVTPWVPNCGAAQPTVYIGPEGVSTLFCPIFSTGAAEVVLGARPRNDLGPPKNETLNGLVVAVSTEQMHEFFHGTCGCSAVITSTQVSVKSKGLFIFVHAGDHSGLPGGAPRRAEQIVQTFHATTHAIANACTASPGSPSITLSDQTPTPAITVPMGARVVVTIPKWKVGGDATDITIGHSDILEEVCTVLLPDHGRRSVVLAIGPGRSSMEATTSGLTSGVFIPAWSGTIRVTS